MSRGRILVVDDEPSLLRLLRTALESEDYDVLLASDGQTAFERTKDEHPDLVLLDVMMPVLDGWAVLEKIRTLPNPPRVVCVTAKDTRRDRLRGWRMGADEYVAKPFDVDRLLDVIGEVLTRSGAAQDERRRQALEELDAETRERD